MDRVYVEPLVVAGEVVGRVRHHLHVLDHRVEHVLPEVRPAVPPGTLAQRFQALLLASLGRRGPPGDLSAPGRPQLRQVRQAGLGPLGDCRDGASDLRQVRLGDDHKAFAEIDRPLVDGLCRWPSHLHVCQVRDLQADQFGAAGEGSGAAHEPRPKKDECHEQREHERQKRVV